MTIERRGPDASVVSEPAEPIVDENDPHFKQCMARNAAHCKYASPDPRPRSGAPDGGLAWIELEPVSGAARAAAQSECIQSNRRSCAMTAEHARRDDVYYAWLDSQLTSVDPAFTKSVVAKMKNSTFKADVVCTQRFCRFRVAPGPLGVDAGVLGVDQFVEGASDRRFHSAAQTIYIARAGYRFPSIR